MNFIEWVKSIQTTGYNGNLNLPPRSRYLTVHPVDKCGTTLLRLKDLPQPLAPINIIEIWFSRKKWRTCTVAMMALVGINIVGLPWETRTSGAKTSWSSWRPRRGCCLPASCSSSTTICLLKMPPASKMLSLTLATRSSGQLSMLPITSWEEFRSANFQEEKRRKCQVNCFCKFSCEFLNSNKFSYLNLDPRNLQEKLKEHFFTKNCSDLSLFEQIVLVISKKFQILGLQPRISKVFLDH